MYLEYVLYKGIKEEIVQEMIAIVQDEIPQSRVRYVEDLFTGHKLLVISAPASTTHQQVLQLGSLMGTLENDIATSPQTATA